MQKKEIPVYIKVPNYTVKVTDGTNYPSAENPAIKLQDNSIFFHNDLVKPGIGLSYKLKENNYILVKDEFGTITIYNANFENKKRGLKAKLKSALTRNHRPRSL